MPSRRRRVALALLAAAWLGCATKTVRVPLRDSPDLMVALRSEERDGAPVPRGYAQPATISALRMTHVLSRIEVRLGETKKDADAERRALPSDLAAALGPILSEALAKADGSQEVVVRAKRRERKLGIFSRTFATSFVAFVDAQGQLQVHFANVDRELPAGEDEALPEPQVAHPAHPFKTLPGPHVATIGASGVAVDWRADLFREPVAESEGRRRTILFDSPVPAGAAPSSGNQAVPTDPERLRALADLEADRRAGRISETEYQRRRSELLAAPAP
jgi:hypothetical protein